MYNHNYDNFLLQIAKTQMIIEKMHSMNNQNKISKRLNSGGCRLNDENAERVDTKWSTNPKDVANLIIMKCQAGMNYLPQISIDDEWNNYSISSESGKEDPAIINLLGNLQSALLSQNKLNYAEIYNSFEKNIIKYFHAIIVFQTRLPYIFGLFMMEAVIMEPKYVAYCIKPTIIFRFYIQW